MRHRRLLITFLILSRAAVLDARTWTEVGTGRSFEGDFIKIEDGTESVTCRSSVPVADITRQLIHLKVTSR